jgi:hypothetical protein
MVGVKESEILQHLEDVAERLHVKVCYENLKKSKVTLKSGLCRVRNENRIIVDSAITLSEKIDIFVESLAEFNLEEIYIPPAIRKLLERKAKRSASRTHFPSDTTST